MGSEVWQRDEIQSPCIKICVIHSSEQLCTGCHRTIEEISSWSRLSSEQRKQIIEERPNRAFRLKMRRGGRAAHISNS